MDRRAEAVARRLRSSAAPYTAESSGTCRTGGLLTALPLGEADRVGVSMCRFP